MGLEAGATKRFERAQDNIEALVCSQLGLGFTTSTERKRWYDNTFVRPLRVLAQEGLVERFHDPSVVTAEVGRWRWKQERARTLELALTLGRNQ